MTQRYVFARNGLNSRPLHSARNARRRFAVVLALALGSPSFAQQGMPSEFSLNPQVASSLTKFGLTVIVGSAELIGSAGKSSVAAQDAAVLEKDLTGLVDRYRSQAREASFAASLVQTNGELIITSAQVLATSTGAGAIPAAAIASVARYGNDKFAGYLAEEGMGRARGILSSGLQTMTNADRKKFDASLAAGKYEEAAALFESRTKKLSKMESMLREDPQAASTARELVLQTMQATSSAALIEAGKAHATSKSIERDLAKHVQTTKEFGKRLDRKLGDLEQKSKALNDGIASVRSDLDTLQQGQNATAFQLQLVQDVLFDQQPPSAKLALMKAGAKPGLSVDQRATVVKYLEVEVKKQDILRTASAVVQVASDVNTIMSNLGIQDRRLGDAVRYGTVATTALSQAFSGNYLGAVASVSGLFGGAQKDPNQAQFEKVFAELREIQKKLDTVIQLQQKTLEAIEQLSRQLASVERRLNERLDNIEFELKSLASATYVQLWGNYQPCMTAWDQRSATTYGFDDQSLRFRSVQGLVAYSQDWASDAAFPCASALRGLFSQLRSSAAFGNPIRLQYALDQVPETPPPGEDRAFVRSDLESYLTEVHAPAAGLALQGWQTRSAAKPSWGSIAGLFGLLASPSATATELLSRVRKLDSESTDGRLTACAGRSLLNLRAKTLLCSDSAAFNPERDVAREAEAQERAAKFLKDAIVREQVGYLAKWAGLVAGPANFAPGGAASGLPLSLDELAAAASVPYGRDLIFSALTILDISIAQQAMIYGDLTSYFVFDELWDRQTGNFRSPSSPAQLAAHKLLSNANNPWLRRNVALLLMMELEKKCGSPSCPRSDLAYQVALSPLFELAEARNQPQSNLPALSPITAGSLSRSRELLAAVFSLPAGAELRVTDVSPSGVKIARVASLRVGAYDLPLPSVQNWTSKRLDYPVGMLDRIREREVLAQRWAEYSSLDSIDVGSAIRLGRAMSGGTK